MWNNVWFAGHHTLRYGAMFPVLGAAVGIWTVAVASAAVSALLADLLISTAIGHRSWPASLWFAFGTVTNVAVGRLPFALGISIGLGALLAAQRRWIVPCLVLAVATATASPVVSVFLVIIFGAWAVISVGRDRHLFAAAAVVAIVPVLVISALYPQGGMFPFRWTALLFTLLVCAAVAAIVPARERKVWAVVDAAGLVDGPAEVVGLGIDTATLHIQSRGDLLVRIHGSTFWNADPVTCIETTPDGWILLRDARPGTLQLFLDETAFSPDTNHCSTTPPG